MASKPAIMVMRRSWLLAAACGLGGAGAALAAPPDVGASADIDPERSLVRRLVGGAATLSPRVRLEMPAAFGNGYSVPLSLAVESEMTADDHVRAVHVLAPLNPIVPVATFRFSPGAGRAEVATRIRLAKSQTVLAVAEMGDGSLLLGRAQVSVDTDGCA